ncbi:MAG: hypothetical protein J6V44_15080 [Methanobrevibacter sp.]|nr:hypothetical protein [Methanobrevibacter sp.]MBO7696553.1 hypothetical protein [Methanobrevibacter sp.]
MRVIDAKVGIIITDSSVTDIEQYIVARCANDGWYYWGSWNDLQKAREVAKEIGGSVFLKEA